MIALLLSLLVLPGPRAVALPATRAIQDSLPALMDEVRKRRDDFESERLAEFSKLGTREAAEALAEVFELFGSLHLRREVLRELGKFAAATEARQMAAETLANAATNSPEVELYQCAIEQLVGFDQLGRHYLQQIVLSNAMEVVRELAMRRHTERAGPADRDFYAAVFEVDEKAAAKAEKAAGRAGKNDPKLPYVPISTVLRELALQQLAPSLSPNELAAIVQDKERDATDLRKEGLREIALIELERRGERKARDLALRVFEDKTERTSVRLRAMRIFGSADGAKAAARLIEEGMKDPSVVPGELRDAAADVLAELGDPTTEKKLLKLLDKSKPQDLPFLIRALHACADPSIDERLLAALDSDVRPLRSAAIAAMATRRSPAFAQPLHATLRASNDPALGAAAVDALASILAGQEGLEPLLREAASSPHAEIKNAALGWLAKGDAAAHFDLFRAALDDPSWSTRVQALKALTDLRTAEAVGAIVGRMERETGLMRRRFADALWSLTGEPHRTNAAAWKAWWEKSREGFQPIPPEELAARQAKEELRRLKQTTKVANFFGVKIESHRVVFVVDVSGSMNETLAPKFLGERGAVRMEVAKLELKRAIDDLDLSALFNIVAFSSGVHAWREKGLGTLSGPDKEDAKAFVDLLAANGGTNVYGALRAAFSDPEVDTIVFLSDGEPSVGEVVDEGAIRARVAEWNAHRGVVIHTVAVGGRQRLMEWLATDSGGTHFRYE
jgi:hypothetical protein